MAAELIYWDSATFLAYFQNETGRVERCRGTLERAQAGEVGIIKSSLAIAECLWLRGQDQIPRDRAEIVQKFFRRWFIRVRNLTRNTAESAQRLVWNHGIKPKDAVHVAAALEARVVILETFDEGLLSKSGAIGNPGLIIRLPIAASQTALKF
jgi:predicted nucleic acid-binding protein